MPNVYISSRGQLSKCDQHFIFKDTEGKAVRILPVSTDKILLYEPVSITGEAFHLLAKYNIPVYIRSFSTNDNMSIQYSSDKNVLVRQQQYRNSNDAQKKLEISKSIVEGKIKNQLAFIQRIKRTNKESKAFIEKTSSRIKMIQKDVHTCESLESLRGFEGFSARLYFEVLGKHIKPDWAVFDKRTKNPPKSNVNAVLSFLYYLLSEEIEIALQSENLDCMIGSLHELQPGRKSLVYDLMEEFRTPMVDVLCCKLFNQRQLTENDFAQNRHAMYLTKEGMKKATQSFEAKMKQIIKIGEKEFPCREIFFIQANQYKEVMMGKQDKYIPFLYR